MEKRSDATVKGLFAFWRYGSTYLGGEITRVADDGSVYALSYQGWFFPVFITTEEAGKKILGKLEAIEATYSLKRKKLQDDYLEAVKDAAVWIGKARS